MCVCVCYLEEERLKKTEHALPVQLHLAKIKDENASYERFFAIVYHENSSFVFRLNVWIVRASYFHFHFPSMEKMRIWFFKTHWHMIYHTFFWFYNGFARATNVVFCFGSCL